MWLQYVVVKYMDVMVTSYDRYILAKNIMIMIVIITTCSIIHTTHVCNNVS